jgi:hypothetical protein
MFSTIVELPINYSVKIKQGAFLQHKTIFARNLPEKTGLLS